MPRSRLTSSCLRQGKEVPHSPHPTQREHEKGQARSLGERLVGCGLWGGVELFCAGLEGGWGEEGGFGRGAPALLLTWNKTDRRRLPAKRAEV